MASARFKKQLVDSLVGARRYALTLVRDPSKADDLVQEAILKALTNHSSFSEGTNFNAWLNQIIKNIFLDDQKSHKVSRTTYVGEDETGMIESNSSQQTDASLEAAAEQQIEKVQNFLFELPENERSAIMLWAEGYSYEEIAMELGVSRPNAAVILCRGRKKVNDYRERIEG